MFTDALELKLKLTIGNKIFEIPGGNIKALEVDLHQYGFACQLSFWVSCEQKKDELFSLFIKPDLIKAELTVRPHYNPKNLPVEALKLHGMVMQKHILTARTIENINLKGNPVLYRHYQITFADPAYVLWRQHFPCDLRVDKTVKDIMKEHTGSHITLEYDWDVLDEQHAINTLPLGIGKDNASFYDFVLWFVSSLNGVWTYDCNQNTYTFSKSKKDIGEPVKMDKQDVEDFQVKFPETTRHNANLLNAYSDDPKREPIEQDQSVDGVRRDHLVCFQIASDFESRKDLETQKLKVRQHEIHLIFRNYPLIPFRPGCLIKLEGPLWSKKLLPYGKVYRVRDISLKARSANDEVTADHNMPFAKYHVDMDSQLELRSESWVSLPAFKSPMFPLYVEGKVKSEKGENNQKTYQFYEDAKTSLDQYRVIIPLWDNQEVVVPFEPNLFTGHFYFPAYKNARVLVALYFHSARIDRFLNWGSGVRLPMDTQGNHILFGKDDQSQTSVRHVYMDEKPVLNIKRTSNIDTQQIKIEEGRLILETKEEE